ncbi:MAG: DNA replication and repair protein RecF [Cyclobacteriaceae bacterium]|nr:DNA replication and repair protein RecF [Cyclobacteriaceae bacterium]
MTIENILLCFFKNYKDFQTDFSPEINCIVGPNGSGKTNLLDAIYLLAFSKSAFNATDQQLIFHDENYFSVKGRFKLQKSGREVICSLMKGEKKKLICDKVPYTRMSDHIGEFPMVMISPGDAEIISGGSEMRRRFFDGIISQIDRNYLELLIEYQRALLQRNLLLKHFGQHHNFDYDRVAPYDNIILNNGNQINTRRQNFINDFKDVFQYLYNEISGHKESAELQYASAFSHPDYKNRFRKNIENDRVLQRTNLGIHKDDFEFSLNGYSLKKFGSQGQQKSYLIALKMAQYQVMFEKKGFKPILLLDDIFDKLDDYRILKVLQMVQETLFGQIFITDARPERTMQLLSSVQAGKKIITLPV